MILDYDEKYGSLSVSEEYIFLGTLYGSLIVEEKGVLYQKGEVYNNLILNEDSSAIISGTVRGDVINNGGDLGITTEAVILGKIRTYSGNTRYIR